MALEDASLSNDGRTSATRTPYPLPGSEDIGTGRMSSLCRLAERATRSRLRVEGKDVS
ncbi:hypothetical protein IM543_02035 [Massilia sp. UMI-21]|nr:hypothetical protein IM543_02035 [Massilia sp. UMI-21]